MQSVTEGKKAGEGSFHRLHERVSVVTGFMDRQEGIDGASSRLLFPPPCSSWLPDTPSCVSFLSLPRSILSVPCLGRGPAFHTEPFGVGVGVMCSLPMVGLGVEEGDSPGPPATLPSRLGVGGAVAVFCFVRLLPTPSLHTHSHFLCYSHTHMLPFSHIHSPV